MKKLIALSSAVLVAGCGGPDISRFVGAAWTGTSSSAITCGGQSGSSSSSLSLSFAEGTNSDLVYATADCGTFMFRVNAAGDTASLSNGPISCKSGQDSAAVQGTVTSYTMHTGDGHHLTVHAEGTAAASGQSCSFTLDGTATR